MAFEKVLYLFLPGTVLRSMMLSRLVEVMLGMQMVAVRDVRMVSSLLMVTVFQVLGRFLMMRCRVPGMFGGFIMMVRGVLSHYRWSFQFERFSAPI